MNDPRLFRRLVATTILLGVFNGMTTVHTPVAHAAGVTYYVS